MLIFGKNLKLCPCWPYFCQVLSVAHYTSLDDDYDGVVVPFGLEELRVFPRYPDQIDRSTDSLLSLAACMLVKWHRNGCLLGLLDEF